MKRLLLAIAFLLTASVAQATTYYIDYAAGSNANNGTAKATPWKSHPYMQNSAGCAGAPHSYVHAAGDQFIFKGGVSWPAACFILQPLAGGSSIAIDYYGVDLTWFTGGSFTKPVFDMQNSFPTNASGFCGGSVFCPTPGSAVGWITIDNIEIKNLLVDTSSGQTNGNCNTAAINFTNLATGHFTVQNTYLHGWKFSVTPTASSVSYQTGSVCQTGSNNTLVDNVESTDVDGKVVTTGPLAGSILRFGGGIKNISEVKNSSVHDTMAGCFTVISCHDSQFFRITADIQAYDSSIHTQVIEDDRSFASPGGDLVYNNLVHDNTPVGVTIYVPYNSYIYNNVLWNNSNKQIMLQATSGDSAARVGYVLNNTVDCSNGTACVGMDSKIAALGTLNLKNNHWITDGTPTCFNTPACVNIATIISANNLPMGTVTANTQGYTIANKYKPTTSTNGTVNYGTNLTTLCGSLTALCSDANGASWSGGTYDARPANSGSGSCGGVVTTTPCWDAGAYRYPTSNAIPISFNPNPVAFGNVNVGSSSNIAVTVTNNGGVNEVLSANASVTGTDLSIFSSTCTSGASIPPAGTCIATVRCAPTAAVLRTGTLNITGTANASVSLSCTGTNAISIPSAPTGLTAVASGSSVTLNWTASTGTPTGYNCQKGTVSGGPYTTFASPSGIGCVASGLAGGTYYFVVNAFNSAGTSANSSEANATVVTPVSSATFSPANLQFDNVVQGVASVVHTVTVTSSGTANLVLASSNAVSISGPNAADFAVSGATCTDNLSIVPGNNCTVSVIFTPSTTTSEIASLVIVSNDPNSPDTIILTGTGVSPVTISPTSINFGNVFRNRVSTAQVVTYTNNSGASITFSSVAISTGDSTQFTLGVNTCVGVLTNGSSCTSSLTFTPNSNGQKTSALVFTDNSTGSPRSVTLTGKATSHKVLKIGAIVKYQPPSGVQIINAIWKGKRNQTKETI